MIPSKTVLSFPLQSTILRDPLVVSPEITVMEAITQMSGVRSSCQTSKSSSGQLDDDLLLGARSSCVIVVENDQVIGILTERDIVRLSAQQQPLDRLSVREVMAHPVLSLRESAFTDLFSAVNLLQQHRIRHLPILDEQDQLVGLVTHEGLRQMTQPIDLMRLRLVSEVMTHEVVCANPDDSMLAIAHLMAAHRVSSVVIVQAQNGQKSFPERQIPLGLVTERDIVQFQAIGLDLHTCPVRAVMSSPTFTVKAAESLWTVQQIMEKRLIRRLVVTGEQGELLGIITQTHLLQALNPLELFKLAEVLEAKVIRLEREKVELLENRTLELELLVEARTATLKTKAAREKLSAELARQIRSSLSIQTILQTTVDQVRQALGCSRVNIWKFESDFLITVVAEFTNSPISLVGEQILDSCFDNCKAKYGEGHIRVVNDIDTVMMSECHRQLLHRLQTRSKILVPLLCGEKLWGFLNVVESDCARNWQQEEVELLRDLSVQLAIAIQQATTLQQLEDELSERKQAASLLRESEQRSARAWQQLQNLIEGTAATTGRNFFPALTKYMAEALGVAYVIVTEEKDGQLHSLGFSAHGSLQENFSFNLRNTPCEQALRNGEFHCSSGLQQQFPEDLDLVEMGVESYLGIALRNTQGKSIGNLCLLDPRPLQDLEQAKNILRVFAARASAELEREQTIKALEQLNQQLETKVEERTAALQASEERWQLALNGANDGIWDWDLRTNKIYFSSRWKAIRGFDESEIGDSWQDWMHCIHPDDKDRLIAIIQDHVVGNTEFFEIEYRVRRKDGEYIWVLDRGQALKNNLNQAIRMSGSETDITQRKSAEEALRESEQRYSSLASAAPVAIFRFDKPLNCIYVNDRWSEMTGRSKESAMGQGWIEALHPEDRAHLLARWKNNFQPVNLAISEGRHLRPDGIINWFSVHVAEEIDASGKVISYIGTLTDITNRKLAEQTIQQQATRESLLREITQRIRESIDLQTIFDIACQEIRQVITSNRVSIFKFFPQANMREGEFIAESVVEGYASVLSKNQCCFMDNYDQHRQSSFLVIDDIENSSLSTCYRSTFAKIEVKAALVMPLFCGEELWGLLCIHQCDKPRHWQENEIEFSQQIANQLVIAIQQASLISQLQQELGERQQAEQQLTERNQQLASINHDLARATRLKDEFLANMSHELRTPLNAILGMAEGLQEEIFGQISLAQVKALQTIERSSAHLLELINDILDVAKIESGQMTLDCAPTAIIPLCQSSLAFIKQQAHKKGIQLEIKLPDTLPDLMVDERRIRQVLINLLNNAVKFTPEAGRVSLEITQLYSEADSLNTQQFLQFAVKDTGIGISHEHIDQLFQPFIQIDSALNRQYMGTGLGLALVKRIVELHGGRVGLTSEIGIGSCFTVELPCIHSAQIHLQPPRELPSNNNVKYLETNVSPIILLAEDNEANIITTTSYLVAKGYQVLSAKNGQEAVKMAQLHCPDIILMDIQMPIMDGLQAIHEIRLDPQLSHTMIIALTALAMPGDQERCLEAGANDYICKPVKLKQLTITIQQLLNYRGK